ncbi:hypothetical protein [Sulfurimonas autotrophica]|uniref:JHP0747 family n=1 Tax=Sulfurimonas autotrophica (strain ATCC BAA-671 / DSM 16294 / JCM 11897 / OK10) TaxID=563040 RepID=E0UV54_SULAO|nr:hypothetical protein [Sulfurimonas autotrophica]ADN09636.1 conserved hypothetical protein [Sulfurimonas autotrophica DSM 16294]
MRIAVECQSPLLQKSLELFLAKHLSSSKKSDIIIRDEECLNESRCFYISSDENADLVKPFSKSQLILALEKKYNDLYPQSSKSIVEEEDVEETMNFEILEKRIELLTQEYQENILRAVKAFYEK